MSKISFHSESVYTGVYTLNRVVNEIERKKIKAWNLNVTRFLYVHVKIDVSRETQGIKKLIIWLFLYHHRSDLSDHAHNNLKKILKISGVDSITTSPQCLWSQEASRVFYRSNSRLAMILSLISTIVSSWSRWHWYPACYLVWIGSKILLLVLYLEQLVLMVDLYTRLAGYKVSMFSLKRLNLYWIQSLESC